MSCRRAVTFRALTLGCSLLLSAVLGGCMTDQGLGAQRSRPAPTQQTLPLLDGLLPTDVLLLGEQHDASAHQTRQRAVLNALLARDQLATLVIEMAERGGSTNGLPPQADETQVRKALRWSAGQTAGWDWSVYGPLVMRAVRAGVPVVGGNLPRAELRGAMQDPYFDARLAPESWSAQQVQIRQGHCGLLPESQVVPMARGQVARDLAMAGTVESAMRSGQTVLLVAGNQHVRRDLGVPQHLGPKVRSKTVIMASGEAADGSEAPSADQVWRTEPVPGRDYCAEFKAQMKKR
jgi:uncharacterized iron-regulated protein